LADIGHADREPGDDQPWAEHRAALDLPKISRALQTWREHTTPPALTRKAAPVEQQGAVALTALLHPAYECGDGSADGAQLVDEEWWHPIMGCDSLQEVVDNARAVWARAQGASPGAEVVAEISDEELLRTYGLAKRNHCYEGPIDDWPKRAERAATVCGLRAVLARYARPAIQPVPVSERLPEKKDLDKNGRCWVYLNERTTTHWLPHWALPVPAADQQEGQGDA
jgi:hypothetical protein